MNKNQKILLIALSVVLFLMLLIPPFHMQRSGTTFGKSYSFIFASPGEYFGINIGMLFMQYLFVLTIGGILYFVLKDKNDKIRIDNTKGDINMPVERIASKIIEAERQNRKIAMFHFQTLIHADEFRGVDAIQFCRDVGMRDSFATEFRKMMSLAQMIKDEGYVLKKA